MAGEYTSAAAVAQNRYGQFIDAQGNVVSGGFGNYSDAGASLAFRAHQQAQAAATAKALADQQAADIAAKNAEITARTQKLIGVQQPVSTAGRPDMPPVSFQADQMLRPMMGDAAIGSRTPTYQAQTGTQQTPQRQVPSRNLPRYQQPFNRPEVTDGSTLPSNPTRAPVTKFPAYEQARATGKLFSIAELQGYGKAGTQTAAQREGLVKDLFNTKMGGSQSVFVPVNLGSSVDVKSLKVVTNDNTLTSTPSAITPMPKQDILPGQQIEYANPNVAIIRNVIPFTEQGKYLDLNAKGQLLITTTKDSSGTYSYKFQQLPSAKETSDLLSSTTTTATTTGGGTYSTSALLGEFVKTGQLQSKQQANIQDTLFGGTARGGGSLESGYALAARGAEASEVQAGRAMQNIIAGKFPEALGNIAETGGTALFTTGLGLGLLLPTAYQKGVQAQSALGKEYEFGGAGSVGERIFYEGGRGAIEGGVGAVSSLGKQGLSIIENPVNVVGVGVGFYAGSKLLEGGARVPSAIEAGTSSYKIIGVSKPFVEPVTDVTKISGVAGQQVEQTLRVGQVATVRQTSLFGSKDYLVTTTADLRAVGIGKPGRLPFEVLMQATKGKGGLPELITSGKAKVEVTRVEPLSLKGKIQNILGADNKPYTVTSKTYEIPVKQLIQQPSDILAGGKGVPRTLQGQLAKTSQPDLFELLQGRKVSEAVKFGSRNEPSVITVRNAEGKTTFEGTIARATKERGAGTRAVQYDILGNLQGNKIISKLTSFAKGNVYPVAERFRIAGRTVMEVSPTGETRLVAEGGTVERYGTIKTPFGEVEIIPRIMKQVETRKGILDLPREQQGLFPVGKRAGGAGFIEPPSTPPSGGGGGKFKVEILKPQGGTRTPFNFPEEKPTIIAPKEPYAEQPSGKGTSTVTMPKSEEVTGARMQTGTRTKTIPRVEEGITGNLMEALTKTTEKMRADLMKEAGGGTKTAMFPGVTITSTPGETISGTRVQTATLTRTGSLTRTMDRTGELLKQDTTSVTRTGQEFPPFPIQRVGTLTKTNMDTLTRYNFDTTRTPPTEPTDRVPPVPPTDQIFPPINLFFAGGGGGGSIGGQSGDRGSRRGRGKRGKVTLFYSPFPLYSDILAFKGKGFGTPLPQKTQAKFFLAKPFAEVIPTKEFYNRNEVPQALGKVGKFKPTSGKPLTRLVFGRKTKRLI